MLLLFTYKYTDRDRETTDHIMKQEITGMEKHTDRETEMEVT